MHLRIPDIDSRCFVANREERFASCDFVQFPKALAERFEDFEFMEIWHDLERLSGCVDPMRFGEA